MTQVLLPPENPLNLVIKQQILNTLGRTDIYTVAQYAPDKKIRTTQIRNFNDEILISYDYDETNKIYTINSMGIVVAKMLWNKTIFKTQQHEHIFDIINAIDAKRKELKTVFEAKQSMSKEESLAYQMLLKESQNARYN